LAIAWLHARHFARPLEARSITEAMPEILAEPHPNRQVPAASPPKPDSESLPSRTRKGPGELRDRMNWLKSPGNADVQTGGQAWLLGRKRGHVGNLVTSLTARAPVSPWPPKPMSACEC